LKQFCFDERKKDEKTKFDERSGNDVTSKMTTSVMTSRVPTATYIQPIFSDEELSEIFQIDFAEIFGSPDKPSTPSNKYGPKTSTVLSSKGIEKSTEKVFVTWCFLLSDPNPALKSVDRKSNNLLLRFCGLTTKPSLFPIII